MHVKCQTHFFAGRTCAGCRIPSNLQPCVRVHARFQRKTARVFSPRGQIGFLNFFTQKTTSASDARHAAVSRRLRDRVRDRADDLLVERHRHDVLCGQLFIRDTGRDRLCRRELHLLIDVACADVERAAENAREREHVIDLVRDNPNGRCRQQPRLPLLCVLRP